ncbi:GGDEF domain-containing protein [Rhodococcoides fascians]|uniref:GGDEF domain-containing protein n=1 Tax=Rhodococcoides fascians TaxID=1828 RepID=UPI000ACBEFA7|nr:GGDEF domain-containing protein [Rhodococcus fascians]
MHRTHIGVGIWCLLYAVLGVLVAHTPAGFSSPTERAAGYLLTAAAVIVGAGWIRGPWPTETASRMSVAYLEISAAAALLMLADPMVALASAAALGVSGSYIAAFHSPKLFLAHQGWAITLSGVLFTKAVKAPGGDVVLASTYLVLLTLVLFSAPILTQSLLLLLRRDAANAFFDPLTGLYNRRGMDAALDDAPAGPSTATVIVVDMDNFKHVNDRHGHAHGDMVLRRAAATIDAAFPSPAITARTGGDEFAIITFLDTAGAIAAADSLRIALSAEPHYAVTASIGIASAPTTFVGYQRACKRADAAMYAAKRAGGNTIITDAERG